MDRKVATQIVAMLVVLSVLIRWIPAENSVADPLGRGAPLDSLALDEYLQQLEEFDPEAPRAFLRGYGRKDPERWLPYWRRRLREAARIHERFADEPELFVQFKGVPRNEMWPLMYDLYPIPMKGIPFESGSSEDDPTLPGAIVLESRLERPVDMDPEALKEQRRAERKARDAGQGGG